MDTFAYIDDNRHNLEFIGLVMEKDFTVSLFQEPVVFLNQFPETSYTAILVDIHMPLMDGFTLYEKLVEHPNYNGCPIIFISSDDSDLARIKSFSLGAVDFLSRNMTPDEIITRIKSKILFYQKHRSIIEFGSLRMDLTLLKAYLGQEELKLTFIEFKLLCHFLKSYPEFTTKEVLSEKVWANQHVLDATIYTHLFNLNSKLLSWDHEVLSERNKGMVLVKKPTKR